MTEASVKLWWASIDDFDASFESFESDLRADERGRAARFRVDEARRRFVLGRVLLRRQLGATLGVEPADLVFESGRRGKPGLAAPDLRRAVGFNLSHSGPIVALVIAHTEVGIDVERLRRVPDADRLARRFFSRAESDSVLGLTGAARDRAFLRVWTQKEAYLKATGVGVGMPLREVETEPDPDAPPRLVAISGDRVEARRWRLIDVEIPASVCTVASLEPDVTIECRKVTSADLEYPSS
jgi:4'-phosphopantetheinyl transferase